MLTVTIIVFMNTLSVFPASSQINYYSLVCHTNFHLVGPFYASFCVCFYFRAVVFIAHGVSEHCERHHKLAVLLQENQFAVYAHDHGINPSLY